MIMKNVNSADENEDRHHEWLCVNHMEIRVCYVCDKTDTELKDTTKTKQNQTTQQKVHASIPTHPRLALPPHPTQPNPCPPGKELAPMPGRRRVWRGKRSPVVAGRGHPHRDRHRAGTT